MWRDWHPRRLGWRWCRSEEQSADEREKIPVRCWKCYEVRGSERGLTLPCFPWTSSPRKERAIDGFGAGGGQRGRRVYIEKKEKKFDD